MARDPSRDGQRTAQGGQEEEAHANHRTAAKAVTARGGEDVVLRGMGDHVGHVARPERGDQVRVAARLGTKTQLARHDGSHGAKVRSAIARVCAGLVGDYVHGRKVVGGDQVEQSSRGGGVGTLGCGDGGDVDSQGAVARHVGGPEGRELGSAGWWTDGSDGVDVPD